MLITIQQVVQYKLDKFIIAIDREFLALPREGEWVELATDLLSSKVRSVIHLANGTVNLSLVPIESSFRGVIEDCHSLVDDYGWRWITAIPAF